MRRSASPASAILHFGYGCQGQARYAGAWQGLSKSSLWVMPVALTGGAACCSCQGHAGSIGAAFPGQPGGAGGHKKEAPKDPFP
jgi:hypothetical protein